MVCIYTSIIQNCIEKNNNFIKKIPGIVKNRYFAKQQPHVLQRQEKSYRKSTQYDYKLKRIIGLIRKNSQKNLGNLKNPIVNRYNMWYKINR